ncbi:MAG: hypothetical protein M1165_02150, partial [Candidatus Pacearchaeota archaeon]|nr:hypothetical protein [Candidatus Pacearchaeota archaeon]
MEKGSFDLLGNIAIVKFQKGIKTSDKKLFAGKLMKENNSVKTVLEKIGKFKGRLRKQTTRYLSGQKNKEQRPQTSQ